MIKSKGPYRFVVCLESGDYPESLEWGKIYRVVPDVKGAKVGFIRIIDESGEDYLYPKALFTSVRLTLPAQRALSA